MLRDNKGNLRSCTAQGVHQGSGGKVWQYRGHLCVGVLGKASIQNGIGDLQSFTEVSLRLG